MFPDSAASTPWLPAYFAQTGTPNQHNILTDLWVWLFSSASVLGWRAHIHAIAVWRWDERMTSNLWWFECRFAAALPYLPSPLCRSHHPKLPRNHPILQSSATGCLSCVKLLDDGAFNFLHPWALTRQMNGPFACNCSNCNGIVFLCPARLHFIICIAGYTFSFVVWGIWLLQISSTHPNNSKKS